MALMPGYASVSFARTPLSEIGGRIEELEALGWRQDDDRRGDPWAAVFLKVFPEETAGEATAELRRVMGDYWLEPEEMRALRHDVSDPGVTSNALHAKQGGLLSPSREGRPHLAMSNKGSPPPSHAWAQGLY